MTTHLGANALADGEAGSAVSAAINLMFSPTITAAICQLQVRNRRLEFATGTAAVTMGCKGDLGLQLHMSWAACAGAICWNDDACSRLAKGAAVSAVLPGQHQEHADCWATKWLALGTSCLLQPLKMVPTHLNASLP